MLISALSSVFLVEGLLTGGLTVHSVGAPQLRAQNENDRIIIGALLALCMLPLVKRLQYVQWLYMISC